MILDDFGDFWCPTERDARSMFAGVATTIRFEEESDLRDAIIGLGARSLRLPGCVWILWGGGS